MLTDASAISPVRTLLGSSSRGARPPVVVGGIGYSGTRVVMRIAREAGLFMGANLNDTEDSLEFFELAERWSARRHAAWLAGRPSESPRGLERQLRRCIRRHRRPLSDPTAPWGWKQPRSIHLLPILAGGLPGMRFLHVIRDGRDLAFGPETAVRIAAGVRGTGVYSAVAATVDAMPDELPPATLMMMLWAEVNELAADYGEAQLGERYRVVRLEDLCAHPEQTVASLLEFLEVDDLAEEAVQRLVAEIVTPSSVGSHRAVHDAVALASVESAGASVLARFGYPIS